MAQVPISATNGNINGDVCIGDQCLLFNNYGPNAVTLRKDNIGILFDDTSNDPGFPNTDWRLFTNDDFAGGKSYFALRNMSDGVTPFLISEAAREHALFIDSQSRLGVGTNAPEESIHIIGEAGQSTSFMLENTGTGGIGDGRWEFLMRAADGEFAINDADTQGGDFIFVGPSDQVAGDTALSILNPQKAARWNLTTRGNDGDFEIDDDRTDVTEVVIRGNMTDDPKGPGLSVFGKIYTIGSCSAGCDEVFSPNYDLPTIEDHAAQMFANSYLPTVGPTRSGEFDLTQKVLTMLNELEKAHIYIAQLNAEKSDLAERVAALEAEREN